VEKTIDVVEGGIAVPDGCEVEQVHMVRRLHEREDKKRYPSIDMLGRFTQWTSIHMACARPGERRIL
jgi:hypothetical protein